MLLFFHTYDRPSLDCIPTYRGQLDSQKSGSLFTFAFFLLLFMYQPVSEFPQSWIMNIRKMVHYIYHVC